MELGMAEGSDLEKTEPATPKRIEKSREDGQVARSQELTTFTVLMASAAGVWFMGSKLIDDLLAIVKNGIQLDRDGNIIVSHWEGRVFRIASDGTVTKLLDTSVVEEQTADIEYVPELDLLVVPTFFGNRITAYEVSP